MQINQSYYGIKIDELRKTYSFYLKSNPPKSYDEVVTTLEKIEKVLLEKYQVINCSPNRLLDVSQSIFKSCDLPSFYSFFGFIYKNPAAELQKRIENLIYPPKIFFQLSDDNVHGILSNLSCKNLNSIALLNHDGKQYVEEQIIDRAKLLGYTGEIVQCRIQFYLRDLFKNANKFSKELVPKKYICLNGEETLANIQRLVSEKIFLNFNHEGLPLIHFLILNYPSLVSFFINKETINQKGVGGKTLLMVASQNHQENIVKLLLENGAEANLKDDNGNTSLHTPFKTYSAIRIIKLLLDHGADINAKNIDGNTPLHVAATLSSKEVMKFLESKDADLNIYNNKNQRAFTLLLDHPEFQPCTLNHFEKLEQYARHDYTGGY